MLELRYYYYHHYHHLTVATQSPLQVVTLEQLSVVIFSDDIIEQKQVKGYGLCAGCDPSRIFLFPVYIKSNLSELRYVQIKGMDQIQILNNGKYQE